MFETEKQMWLDLDKREKDEYEDYTNNIVPLFLKIKEAQKEYELASNNRLAEINAKPNIRFQRFSICRKLQQKGLSRKDIAFILGINYTKVCEYILYDGKVPLNRQQRKLVLERDGFKCRVCSTQNNLHIHHIKTTSHRPFNLMTLCPRCHKRFDILKTNDRLSYQKFADFFINENRLIKKQKKNEQTKTQ